MAEHFFKTVYFPRDRVASGKAARVTLSFPLAPDSTASPEVLGFVSSATSGQLRVVLGDPLLDDLEREAETERRSLSNLVLRRLIETLPCRISHLGSSQLSLLADSGIQATDCVGGAPGVTFRDSLRKSVHGWYPYVEGFSATYARDAILRYDAGSVFDPFGGAGTTQVASSLLGIPSYYCEVNPFMAFVAETKVTSAAWARENLSDFSVVARHFIQQVTSGRLEQAAEKVDLSSYEHAFPGRDFFQPEDLRRLIAARDMVRALANVHEHARSLLLLACASNVVRSSNMTRRADLRRRRADEYKNRVVDVSGFIAESVSRMLEDVATMPTVLASTEKLAADCRTLPPEAESVFDLAITSPPYLNGTNYFRNTKLELWYLGFIDSEDELRAYRKTAIRAGINNISKGTYYEEIESVEAIARRLDHAAMDKRIPLMVRGYFSDMKPALAMVFRSLKPGGRFLVDIGDSRFYGVNVPTHSLLAEVAESVGFQCEATNFLAHRYSYDKTPLSQVELVLHRPLGRNA